MPINENLLKQQYQLNDTIIHVKIIKKYMSLVLQNIV